MAVKTRYSYVWRGQVVSRMRLINVYGTVDADQKMDRDALLDLAKSKLPQDDQENERLVVIRFNWSELVPVVVPNQVSRDTAADNAGQDRTACPDVPEDQLGQVAHRLFGCVHCNPWERDT